jgi:glycosyltransferase involved in cell wall biosynthesis
VVFWAAWWNGARFGFDFEDFYRGDSVERGDNLSSTALVSVLEDRYLPRASIMTAASWAIAAEVAKATGLPEPLTILNVFPWKDRAQLAASALVPQEAPLSLYWFSQIISLDRGLQDVIVAMGLMHQSAVLHVRGADCAGSIGSLRKLAADHGVLRNVHFHPPVPPGALLLDASHHDVGLCLESPHLLNRDICITNKVFLYMLAGLAIVASRTRGQRMVLDAAPGIGLDYESGNAQALAEILDRYAADRDLLERTKASALLGAQKRWNWERESEALVTAIGALA